MQSFSHAEAEPEAARTRSSLRNRNDTGLMLRAAAAGRADVLGISGLMHLQRDVGNAATAELVEESRSPVLDVISSGGTALEPEVRADMEARLGADFSDVRIHTDDAAHKSAEAVSAHAYTVGSDIAFQRDAYDPGSQSGQKTLAHELTHVVQQRSGPVDGTPTGNGVSVSDPSDRFEREAASNAERVLSAPEVSTVRSPLQRRESDWDIQTRSNEADTSAQGLAVQRDDDGPGPETQSAGPSPEGTSTGGADAPAGPSVSPKATITIPSFKPPSVPAGYVDIEFEFGGSADYELDAGDESTGSAAPSASVGVDATADGPKYQAEAGVAFQSHVTDLLGKVTPKAKIGGEADSKGGNLGIEFSLDSEHLEPKIGFSLIDIDEQKGIHFAALEVSFDMKWTPFQATMPDGTKIKMSPKVTPKLTITPDYAEIFKELAKVGAEVIATDALIVGALIAGASVAILGTLLTLEDGKEEADALDEAAKDKPAIAQGFIAAASGIPLAATNDYFMEGWNRGDQWRRDLQAGNNSKGTPIPPSVITDQVPPNAGAIEASANATATQMMHQALVEMYWQIHYIEKHLPGEPMADTYRHLMEGNGFGLPDPYEGKDT